jgi:hypothetical protein
MSLTNVQKVAVPGRVKKLAMLKLWPWLHLDLILIFSPRGSVVVAI